MPRQSGSCLVVDDDPAMRMLLRVQLEAVGGSVTEAADPQTAMGALQARSFDMVIIDHELRDAINGTELLRRCAELDHPPTSRFLMSAHIDETIEAAANEVQAHPLDKLNLDPAMVCWRELLTRDAAR